MEEELVSTQAARKQVVIAQVEASTKVVENNIVIEIIIDLTNTCVMDETPEMFRAAPTD